jgi:hypothetical protein
MNATRRRRRRMAELQQFLFCLDFCNLCYYYSWEGKKDAMDQPTAAEKN